jgi:glucosyl-dolichyl phosphate glucuronosyltransferase
MSLFTVILCSYNGGKKLNRVIESVIKQNDYGKLVNKFLLVDNNSNDNTSQIMKKFEDKYSNIKYILEKQQGLSYSRLAGILQANTEWIIFVDDDNALEQGWIKSAEEYIRKNSNVGAFGGTVIPEFDIHLSNREKDILAVVYPGLACTHLSINDVDYDASKHPNEVPYGAGLVIRTYPLIELSKNGWLRATGRIGNKLAAGDDTEMCNSIKRYNYEFGFNPNMIIKHLIEKRRLNLNYLIKMYQGFAEYNSFSLLQEYKFDKYLFNLHLKKIVYYFLCCFSLKRRVRIKSIIFFNYNLRFMKNALSISKSKQV